MSIHIIFRTYNGKEEWPSYNDRVKGVVKAFFDHDLQQIGLIGMQEVKDGEPHGVYIFRDEANRIYGQSAAAIDYKSLGIVVDQKFEIHKTLKKYLGKDSICHLGNRAKRRLLGVQLSHPDFDNLFWFFTTHLSHGNQSAQRKEQMEKIIDAIHGAVNINELPPWIVGDFNWGSESEEAHIMLEKDFSLVFGEGIDQIWIGRPEKFNCRTINLYLIESKVIDLKSTQLSDHNSPSVKISYGSFKPPWLIPG
jgi:hypothetical protein